VVVEDIEKAGGVARNRVGTVTVIDSFEHCNLIVTSIKILENTLVPQRHGLKLHIVNFV
jgi:hypothetical protein